jgi:hypothetical protein
MWHGWRDFGGIIYPKVVVGNEGEGKVYILQEVLGRTNHSVLSLLFNEQRRTFLCIHNEVNKTIS